LRPILSPDKITWIDLVNELVHASNDVDFGDIRIVSNEVVHFLIDTRKLTERWGQLQIIEERLLEKLHSR
jgi:hypothetical protein